MFIDIVISYIIVSRVTYVVKASELHTQVILTNETALKIC